MSSVASPVARINPPQLHLGYGGETVYTWRGQRWACRHHEAPHSFVQSAKREANRLIGCVYGDGCDNRHEFPPLELMAFFPGYVRACYRPTGETYQFETTCGPVTVDRCEWDFEEEPRRELTSIGWRAIAWREDCEREGVKVSPAIEPAPSWDLVTA